MKNPASLHQQIQQRDWLSFLLGYGRRFHPREHDALLLVEETLRRALAEVQDWPMDEDIKCRLFFLMHRSYWSLRVVVPQPPGHDLPLVKC